MLGRDSRLVLFAPPLSEDLDKSVPIEGAYVKMTRYGGGITENQIIANRNGYLRLGIEFLKAAFAEKDYEQKELQNRINIDLDYLIKNPDVYFDWFERTEETPTEEMPSDFKKEEIGWKVIPVALLIFLGACVVLVVIGFMTVMGWLF